jgi:hypothetical protein
VSNPLPLADSSARLKRQPGRPRTRAERPPAPVVQVGGVAPLAPRLLDRQGAAVYYSVAPDTIDQLDAAGVLSRVRLPNGSGGDIKRVLYDREDLDALVARMKDDRP